jgi:hypothetical protein
MQAGTEGRRLALSGDLEHRKAMLAARDHSIAGSLAYYFMDWRHMTEILSAKQEIYIELLNLCVWAKIKGGIG